MPAGQKRQVIIGAIAMAVLAVVIALSYRGEAIGLGSDFGGYRLFALFNRIDGLGDGAPVYLSGIQVGRVESTTLQPDFRARIALRMDEGVQLPVDTAAAIHTNGLFGSKFVNLDPGGAEETLKDDDTITYTQDALIVTQLLDLIIAQGKAARQPEPATSGPAGGAGSAAPDSLTPTPDRDQPQGAIDQQDGRQAPAASPGTRR